MSTTFRWTAVLLLAAGSVLVGLAAAAPVPKGPETGTIKDRKSFIPQRKYQPLPGTVVGVLVSDVRR